MRPDTPLCETLRPGRRRLQLLGRCPSLQPARPPLCPVGQGVHGAPGGRQRGRTGRDGPRPQRPGAAALWRTPSLCPHVSLRPCRPLPALGPKDLAASSKPRADRRDRTSVSAPAARHGRQEAQGRSYWGPFPSWSFLPSPIHTPLGSHGMGSAPSSSFRLWSRGSLIPHSGLLGNFLEGPHYAKYLPFLSPFPLHLSPILSILSLPPALPVLPSFLSLFLFDYSYGLFPVPCLFYPPHFSPMSVSLVCLSVSLPHSLSPPLLLLISLIGSPAPALLMSPIHSRA